ncbi:MAG: thioredoxin domain-containing protein [Sphingomonadales bacterium]|nr:thioredoxin domain-containing protein [Sphingomonadales bacterium]
MSTRFTNRLADETSPYLLQHAHNPVDWYPWGHEALGRARAEDKPILVSIGYAACHWCHVMEKESFEDEATAAIMNEHFINIKIDREERPDLDHIYMDALQTISGSGGWPLNIFLTPDAKPFYGGTYFPPVRAYNRASWKETLLGVQQAWSLRKHELLAQAENLTAHLQQSNAFGATATDPQELISIRSLTQIAATILQQADTHWGGFGKAPKFPQSFTILFLLRHYHFTNDEASLQQALLSLNKMMQGGLYDQLGGGFARYATDTEWLAPHFEKMLYDNALLIVAYAEAYQLTGNETYRTVVRETMHFVQRELLSPEAGFFSALDADSEGVEGKFYTWSAAEIETLLQKDAALFNAFYDVRDEGNWEHTNILWIKEPIENFCATRGLDEKEFRNWLAHCKQRLMTERAHRIRPLLDDKIILGWNALMNKACSKAYAITGDRAYQKLAIDNMEFLLSKFRGPDQNWLHVYKKQARFSAVLEDLAYLAEALICLFEVTANTKWLHEAETLTNYIVGAFSDPETPFFFYTHSGQGDVIIRKKEVYDGAVPSSNAMIAIVLHHISLLLDKPEWGLKSLEMTSALGNAILRYPTSFGNWACLLQEFYYGTNEISLVGKNYNTLKDNVLNNYIPYKLLQAAPVADPRYPFLRGKDSQGETALWLCKNYTCLAPVHAVSELISLIDKAEQRS